MISRLIDMNVSYKNKPENKQVFKNNGKFSIDDYANAFISGMGETQLNRFKNMLENNIQCGMSVALNYGIDYQDFIKEVKNKLKVGV